MRYDPGAGRLVCGHCGHAEPIAAPGAGPWGGGEIIRELDFQQALKAQLPAAEMEETRVLACPNCGAEVQFSAEVHAKECPFCATPIVTDTGISRHIKPKGVAPFLLDERAARAAMTAWLGRLWFAPSGLQEFARKGRRMDGVYVPYWTFDAQTQTQYTGLRGETYFVTRQVGDKQVTETRVRWFPAAGRVARFFDDVLVMASRSLPKNFVDALPPWDLSRLEPYRAEYIAGMRAEAYQVELEDGFREARAWMDRVIERDVRFDIGGDQQQIRSMQTQLSGVTFKHVLLPVWVAAYRYNGQPYRIVINGQSGRVQGERPWSAWKIAVAVVAAAIAAAALGYVYAHSQGGF